MSDASEFGKFCENFSIIFLSFTVIMDENAEVMECVSVEHANASQSLVENHVNARVYRTIAWLPTAPNQKRIKFARDMEHASVINASATHRTLESSAKVHQGTRA